MWLISRFLFIDFSYSELLDSVMISVPSHLSLVGTFVPYFSEKLHPYQQ